MEKDPEYTKKIAKDGQVRYYRDGRLIQKKQMPKEELLKLQEQLPNAELTIDEPVVETATVKEEPVCLICAAKGTRQRFVNLQIVHVCEKHYFKTSLGKLVIALREKGSYEQVSPN